MMQIFKGIVFGAFAVAAALGQTLAPQNRSKPFVATQYPTSKFHISRNEYSFGELTVRVIDVKTTTDVATTVPHYCDAWLEILKGSQLLKRLYYSDIEPVGFSFGVFVPREQPVPDYFLVVKEGDYDGRLLLVDREGTVTDIPGGFYFVTADKKYVISEYASDDSEPSLTVFDVVGHRVSMQPKDTPEIGSWYRDQSGYFFMEYNHPGHAERLDLENQKLLKITISENDRKNAEKVQYNFDPRKKQDCVSMQQ